MFELNSDDLAHAFLTVVVTDFVKGVKSFSVSEDAPISRLALLHFEIHIVIDAPKLFCAAEAIGDNTFFLDVRSKSRRLKKNQYQVIYDGAEDDQAGFYQWACECANFFKIMQFNFGLVCIDYADFLTALSYCEGTTLRFEKLTYDQHSIVPYDKHSGSPYRVIYGCLDGGLDLSFGHFEEFQKVLKANNPQLVMMTTAMKITKSPVYSMMLLGESAVAKKREDDTSTISRKCAASDPSCFRYAQGKISTDLRQ